jgi:ABC-2 type transport system permease protein/sodium transport system permease protein
MSAIMIAVCSYARTFKEAQNYVTPVILAVLIPGGIAALPATRMEGVMLVMPVGNMVLLARDLLLGANVPVWQVATILLSTTMYAGAAVAVAATIFGRESVVFSDTASLKTIFTRTLVKPSRRPSVAMSLLFVALLFPLWFFVQSGISTAEDADATSVLYTSAWLMPLLFVGVPVVIMLYWKVDVASSLALRRPGLRHLFAAALIGLSAWVPAHEVTVLQQKLIGAPQAIVDSAELFEETLKVMPFALALVFIAVIPAVSEELLFRGFLLSGLRSASRKWTAIIVTAVVFAVFHFFFFRFAVTAVLGVVLAYLCWQSRSIFPAMVAHFLHNGVGATLIYFPQAAQWLGMGDGSEEAAAWSHLPVAVLIVGCAALAAGLFATARPMAARRKEPMPISVGG